MPRLVIQKGEAAGQDRILGGECVLGRHPTVDFVIDDTLVSRRHCKVLSVSGHWVVEDLGSTNGTLVNGQRTRRAGLRDGDVIQIGSTQLLFVQKDLLDAMGHGKAQAAPVPPSIPEVAVPPPAVAAPAPPTSSPKPAAPVPRRRRR